MKILKVWEFIKEAKKLSKTASKRLNKKNDKIVEEDEMDVSTLNPGAPMDNLECSDSFATGDFRFPALLQPFQKRKRISKRKKSTKNKN